MVNGQPSALYGTATPVDCQLVHFPLFAVAVAEAAADVGPHGVAHHLRRQPRALLRAGWGWWVHVAGRAPKPGAGTWASSWGHAATVDTPVTADVT
jgi:hypothetical protein